MTDIDTSIEKRNEGCSLIAYRDSVGVWTIGYGHTNGVLPGDTCTPLKAELWLLDDLQNALHAVEDNVKVPLTQEQLSALVDFVFNVGEGNFEHSTLLKKINALDFEGAAEEFKKWDHAGGKVLVGLTRRRAEEEALFRRGIPT